MEGFSIVPDRSLSVAHGIPLEEEPGIGALTLPGFLREVTGRHGPNEAIAQPRPGGAVERWSYDDLWARSMDVARALVSCGLGKGGRVGILMTNRAEFLSALFGTALAGGVAAPLSTFSTASELDFLIANSACSVLLFEPQVLKRDFLAILHELEPDLARAGPGQIASRKFPFLGHVVSLDREHPDGAIEPWTDFLARGSGVSEERVEARARTVTAGDPAVLMHSSGTTGRPKGILNGQRGVALQLWRWPRIFGVDGPGRTWSANGLFWSGPFGMAIGSALATGGTLVMLATFEPEKALALIESERVTQPVGWPHQWAQLPDAANWSQVDLSSLRYVDPNHVLARHPTVNAQWSEPTRVYGSTETFTISCAYPSGTSEDVLKGSYGFPLPGMTVKVVDPLTGATLRMGERGELAVKGATLMLGYVGVPLDETLDEEGYFRSGDGGYLDEEGRVYWEGRINDIIKTGGANVSPVEVDALLIRYPGVKIVQTIGVPDDLLGERVVSLIAPHEGLVLDEAAIRAFAKEQLASYKVPRRILFVAEEDFSQTGTAKVRAEELRKLADEMLRGQAGR
jgi:acyl-coenzyme A synthetase/AMP-(fatty) acid ligase